MQDREDRPDFRSCYEKAVGVAVAELPGNLEADDQYRGLIDCPNFLRRAWRPSPIDHDLCSLLGAPSFSDAPSVGEKIAWEGVLLYIFDDVQAGYHRNNARRISGQSTAPSRPNWKDASRSCATSSGPGSRAASTP